MIAIAITLIICVSVGGTLCFVTHAVSRFEPATLEYKLKVLKLQLENRNEQVKSIVAKSQINKS